MLEKMDEFFNKRADGYEDHMMSNVEGAKEYYIETANLVPKDKKINILDLGCGTGLELDEILKRNPDANITAIDLATDMVEKIKEKHADKINQINIIVDNYFTYDIGKSIFDVVVSVESLHHYSHEDKIKLYKRIYNSLNENGIYIETDYVAPNQETEDYYYSESAKIRSELNITEGFYHYDTPCTVENQIKMLKKSGFKEVNKVWQKSNTVILIAKK